MSIFKIKMVCNSIIPVAAILMACTQVWAQQTTASHQPRQAIKQDTKAKELLEAAQKKLQVANSIIVDYQGAAMSTRDFIRDSEIMLERPNRFRVDMIFGAVAEERMQFAVSDGKTVTTYFPGS